MNIDAVEKGIWPFYTETAILMLFNSYELYMVVYMLGFIWEGEDGRLHWAAFKSLLFSNSFFNRAGVTDLSSHRLLTEVSHHVGSRFFLSFFIILGSAMEPTLCERSDFIL